MTKIPELYAKIKFIKKKGRNLNASLSDYELPFRLPLPVKLTTSSDLEQSQSGPKPNCQT